MNFRIRLSWLEIPVLLTSCVTISVTCSLCALVSSSEKWAVLTAYRVFLRLPRDGTGEVPCRV